MVNRIKADMTPDISETLTPELLGKAIKAKRTQSHLFVGKHGIALAPFYDLVNIKMYPSFEQEMAMALGDEFSADLINVYQLVDFAEDCQINRSLLEKSLERMIGKILSTLGDDYEQVIINDKEKNFIYNYKTSILDRCEHLLG